MMTVEEYDYLEKRWATLREQERELQKQLEHLQRERARIEHRLAHEIIVEDEN